MEGKYKVIFENDNLMVIDKEAGLVVTDEGRNEKESLEKYLADKIKLKRSGIINRLDKGTSGLLLVAKNEKSLLELKRQFKEREVIKKYETLCCGEVVAMGEIKVPIGRSRYAFSKFAVSEEGKESRTAFKRLSLYQATKGKLSLLEIRLYTGRTHQIRVHFNYMGWPLLGDRTYGGWEGVTLKRPFLHSKYVEFKEPISGERLVFESPRAIDLEEELGNYEKI